MRKYFWPTAFLALVAFRQMAGHELLERFYSRGAYLVLHRLQSLVAVLSPMPLIYLLLLSLLLFLAFRLHRWWRKTDSLAAKCRSLLGGSLSLFSALGFFFLLLWGLNYGRQPVEERLQLKPKPLTQEELLEEYKRVSDLLQAERKTLLSSFENRSDTLALELPRVSEKLVREALEMVLAEQGYPVNLHIPLRELHPGTLLRIGTAGVYLAWSGEGHYDGGLHSLQKPFVMAHEMAHGYGFGDEGICNFWAWLACSRSDSPALRYSALLAYWRYLRAALRNLSPVTFHQAEARLPKGLRADLLAIQKQMARYPDILPRLRNSLYETYLKSQGVKEGMKSYSRLPMLVKAWRAKDEK